VSMGGMEYGWNGCGMAAFVDVVRIRSEYVDKPDVI
jgi:hypothetical protein